MNALQLSCYRQPAETRLKQVRRQMFTNMLRQMSEAPALWKLSPEFLANYMQIAAETIHELVGRWLLWNYFKRAWYPGWEMTSWNM